MFEDFSVSRGGTRGQLLTSFPVGTSQTKEGGIKEGEIEKKKEGE